MRAPKWMHAEWSMRPTEYDQSGCDGLYLVGVPRISWWGWPFLFAGIFERAAKRRLSRLLSFFTIAAALLCVAIPAHALSIDISAMSSTHTRQAVLAGRHLQVYEWSQFETSAQYVATQGRVAAWDAGMENMFMLGGGARLQSDFRYFQDRSTFSGGIGFGIQWVSLTGGFRAEYMNEGDRTTFGKIGITAKGKRGPLALTARAESLHGQHGAHRIDYRAEARYQIRQFYVGLKAEEMRDVKLQAIGLGVTF